MKRPASIKNEFSSGGVIFRCADGACEVALIAVKDGKVWCLPKGLVAKGEKPEETAIREVREETGLEGRVLDELGSVNYWYAIPEENKKVRKTVNYYLLEYIGGSTDDHDFEVDESAWFPVEDALAKVAYKGDRDIITRAKKLMEGHGGKTSRMG